MNLIINDNNFSVNRIELKKSKKSTKIVYKIDTINIIGITFNIKDFNFYIDNHFLFIRTNNQIQKDNLHLIDKYLESKIPSYESFITNNYIKVKKNEGVNYSLIKGINISINSLKLHNRKNKVQIFII
tara:strand:- start:874 stop:1257 length:384 start_codon:yes stop_codon:yes gene_type:complete